MLTGIHILLTLKCTKECDHCFLHCGPSREATFTTGQLRTLIRQIEELETVNIVYFEGGEPFLFYPLLLEGLRMVRAAGFDAGIVTNGYWATSVEDGLHWLRPIRDLGVVDFSVSDDEFHRLDKNDRRAEFARQAAQQLGILTGTICIEPPSVSPQAADGRRGVDDLALQIGQVDLVIIDDAERADAGRGQVHQQGRAKPAGTNDQHARGEQLGLAFLADLVENQVPRITVELRFVQRVRQSFGHYRFSNSAVDK